MRTLSGLMLALIAGASLAGQAPPATFPAQQRPPGDPALVERGGSLYGVYCRSCHGQDLRGGDLGGPNLLRSQLVLNDATGEAIGPVIRQGRTPAAGGTVMPPIPMSDADVRAVAEYLHAVLRTAQPQGAPPRSDVQLNLLVGNARNGERYFAKACTSCHAPSGDLASIGARFGSNIEQLQNSWVAGRRMGSPSATPGPDRRTPTVTLKFSDGREERGRLARLDDFIVSFTDASGRYRSYSRRSAGITTLKVDDPLQRHRELWSELSDQDMHDVTAYLATLK